VVSGKVVIMKSYDRITLYIVILAAIALVVLPNAIAQPSGRGGMRGGGGGGGDRRGDMSMGPRRGGDQGRGGPGMSWMGGREEPKDYQIDLILKAYTNRYPEGAKKLQDQRKTMDKEAFIQTLIRNATPEYYQIMSEERKYTPILEWSEKWVADEAKGIRDLMEVNYDLYKKRLDALENKYWSIIHPRIPMPEELIPVRVKDVQLELKQNELVWQIRTTEDPNKKENLMASLTEIVTERYDLNIQQRTIQLDQIQKQIDSLRRSLEYEMNQIETSKDPNFAEAAIRRRVENLTNPIFFPGGPRTGRSGRGNRPPQISRSDVNDPNSNRVH
jgi:hypothetical protein